MLQLGCLTLWFPLVTKFQVGTKKETKKDLLFFIVGLQWSDEGLRDQGKQNALFLNFNVVSFQQQNLVPFHISKKVFKMETYFHSWPKFVIFLVCFAKYQDSA